MDLAPIWDQLALSISEISKSGLLTATVIAMLVGVAGAFVARANPVVGRLMRFGSTFTLIAVLLLVVLQVSRLDPRFSLVVPEIGFPEQVVEGQETRIPMHIDGHYWLEAEVNGHRAPFMIDTGATLVAVSEQTAAAAGLEERDGGMPIPLQTANGTVAAYMTNIDELRFGNVSASGLDAVIAPGLGQTNVIGMNLISRLASFRIEQGELILTPNNPQPPLETTD